MESKNNKLLQALERNGAEKIGEAYYWVQDNKNMFRAEVYGPVLLEVCSLHAHQLLFSLHLRGLSLYFLPTDLRLIFRIRLTLLTWKIMFQTTYGRY
jgi:hypothetical protein